MGPGGGGGRDDDGIFGRAFVATLHVGARSDRSYLALMPAVESSAILSVDHDAPTRRLEVRFVSGVIYAYAGVPAEVYADFLAAPSKGGYFSAHIRDRYAFARTGGVADG